MRNRRGHYLSGEAYERTYVRTYGEGRRQDGTGDRPDGSAGPAGRRMDGGRGPRGPTAVINNSTGRQCDGTVETCGARSSSFEYQCETLSALPGRKNCEWRARTDRQTDARTEALQDGQEGLVEMDV